LVSIRAYCQYMSNCVVFTETYNSIIRSVPSLSQIYKYQTAWEILTLGKRNNMNKRYINELL